MNRLIHNYRVKILDVLDGHTFTCMIDFGLRRYERTRLQLLNPYPNFLGQGEDPEKAYRLLSYMIMKNDTEGRECILSPTRPNAYNKYYAILYLQCRFSDMSLPSTVIPKFAGYRFVNVNLFMGYMAEHNFNLDEAKRILTGLGIEDKVLNYLPQQRETTEAEEIEA